MPVLSFGVVILMKESIPQSGSPFTFPPVTEYPLSSRKSALGFEIVYFTVTFFVVFPSLTFSVCDFVPGDAASEASLFINFGNPDASAKSYISFSFKIFEWQD